MTGFPPRSPSPGLALGPGEIHVWAVSLDPAPERVELLGRSLAADEWERRKSEWLPTAADKDYLRSIQAIPVYKAGQFANYIAPPQRGINRLPLDFEYVRTEA